ncbi:hypothetical protein IWX65_003561 [Arthrobacter sp. CAN_A214]|uniref:hypothetical protein n=1 Tax=Arthrobacter sp. CAN_A214 TaxID=2787720 RepID=UPI0018CA5A41
MTISETGHGVGFLLTAAKMHTVSDLEALRGRCVQKLLETRRACEEVNDLHADGESGPAGPVHADQEHAQWLLCAAVRDIEDVDALLHQKRQEKERGLDLR